MLPNDNLWLIRMVRHNEPLLLLIEMVSIRNIWSLILKSEYNFIPMKIKERVIPLRSINCY